MIYSELATSGFVQLVTERQSTFILRNTGPKPEQYDEFLDPDSDFLSRFQCFGSRMFIPDPDFLPIPDPGSQILDPKTSKKQRAEKKNCCHTFLCFHKFSIIENYFIFDMPKSKLWPSFQRIIVLFTQKFVTKL